MERCPGCRARLGDAVVCPRCGCELGTVQRAGKQADLLLHRALRHRLAGEQQAARENVTAALALEHSRYGHLLQQFMATIAPPR